MGLGGDPGAGGGLSRRGLWAHTNSFPVLYLGFIPPGGRVDLFQKYQTNILRPSPPRPPRSRIYSLLSQLAVQPVELLKFQFCAALVGGGGEGVDEGERSERLGRRGGPSAVKLLRKHIVFTRREYQQKLKSAGHSEWPRT